MKISKKVLIKYFNYWLPLGITIILLTGFIYGLNQQNLRQSANDPQIQIAEDIADNFSTNGLPTQFPAAQTIDLSKSLSTFLIIYDKNGKEQYSSGELDGKTPTLPSGIFSNASKKGQITFTWQPKKGVREAVVLISLKDKAKGYVLVGRSLREIEKRDTNFLIISIIGGLVTLLVSYCAVYCLNEKKIK